MFGTDAELVCYACQLTVKLQPIVYPHLFLNFSNLAKQHAHGELRDLVLTTIKCIAAAEMQYTANTFEQLLVMTLAKAQLENLCRCSNEIYIKMNITASTR